MLETGGPTLEGVEEPQGSESSGRQVLCPPSPSPRTPPSRSHPPSRSPSLLPMHHLLCKHSWVRVFQRVGFAQGFAIAAPLRGCFTGYNTATKRDVRLCGIAWLHPEIPFCTQTGLSILTRIGSTFGERQEVQN